MNKDKKLHFRFEKRKYRNQNVNSRGSTHSSPFKSQKTGGLNRPPVLSNILTYRLLNFVEALACCVCCVEQLVCLVAVRLTKELLIELDDLRVVMGLTQCLSLIL